MRRRSPPNVTYVGKSATNGKRPKVKQTGNVRRKRADRQFSRDTGSTTDRVQFSPVTTVVTYVYIYRPNIFARVPRVPFRFSRLFSTRFLKPVEMAYRVHLGRSTVSIFDRRARSNIYSPPPENDNHHETTTTTTVHTVSFRPTFPDPCTHTRSTSPCRDRTS